MTNRIDDNLVHFGANEELIRALTEARARFVLIGGLAVAWHCPERQADDMDLLIEPSSENSERIASALASLGLYNFAPSSFAKPGLQVPLKCVLYAELLTPKDGQLSFSEVHAVSVPAKLFGIPVFVASVPHLIEMKRYALSEAGDQFDKHLKDIHLLERHVA